MPRHLSGLTAAAALVALASACSGGQSALAPSTVIAQPGSLFGTGPGGSLLKATVPTPIAPADKTVLTNLTPTLVVSSAGLKYANGAVQYRFRIVDATGTPAMDSGLLNDPNFTVTAPLTPTSTYTWSARVEYQGLTGPWTSSLSFTTPVAPSDNFGAWETACQGLVDAPLVSCIWSFVRPANSFGDLELAKRVAWMLRAKGGGLLLKGSGENTVPWLGFTFSASRICFPDGHIFKILQDAGPGGQNAPIYGDNDFVDPSLYFAAVDPRLK
jgi:hypothetical protein